MSIDIGVAVCVAVCVKPAVLATDVCTCAHTFCGFAMHNAHARYRHVHSRNPCLVRTIARRMVVGAHALCARSRVAARLSGCLYAYTRICMYACMRVCMYVCMRVCASSWYACMHVCVQACMNDGMYVTMRVCEYVSMLVRVHARIHIGSLICKRICA